MIYQDKRASIIMATSDGISTLPIEIYAAISRYEERFEREIKVLDIKYSQYKENSIAMIIVEGEDIGNMQEKVFIKMCEEKYGKPY